LPARDALFDARSDGNGRCLLSVRGGASARVDVAEGRAPESRSGVAADLVAGVPAKDVASRGDPTTASVSATGRADAEAVGAGLTEACGGWA
jgi:hypothetical protein